MCLSVSLSARYLKELPAADRISKLDKDMFHHESWRPAYFGVKRSKVTRHKE